MHRELVALNTRKGSGLDSVPNQVLKACAVALAEPVSYICNKSKVSGVFPDSWKRALVQPVLKSKGERSAPQSYSCRPISLLPCISKVFERFVHKQLVTFATSIEVLPK